MVFGNKKREKNLKASTKIIFKILLGIFLFYPLTFCPFRIPYIYCSICYLKCFWGRIRGLLLLGILGLNLNNRFYCLKMCPCGAIQDLEYKLKVKKFNLSFPWVKYLVLVGLIILVILGFKNYFPFISNSWILYIIVLAIVLSFFIYRFWCLNLCPVGALTDILLKLRLRIKKKTIGLKII